MLRWWAGMALVLLSAAGCAGGGAGSEYLARPGASQEQARRDAEECQEMATRILPGAATRGTYRRVDPDLYVECMERRGYELRKRGTESP